MTDANRPRRRRVHRLLITIVAAGLAPPALASSETTEVPVSEGTNIAAKPMADGSTLLELQGFLFRVPRGGGDAQRLSELNLEPSWPDVSSSGQIAFQSYSGGNFHIWIADGNGANPRQVTTGRFDDREPRWSPDGRHIAFASDRSGSYDIWSVEVASGNLTRWTQADDQEAEPDWSRDGSQVVYSSALGIERIGRTGVPELVLRAPAGGKLNAPSVSPDGRAIAYFRQGPRASRGDPLVTNLMVNDRQVTAGEDVFLFPASWVDGATLLYTADGKIRQRSLGEAGAGVGGATRTIPFRATLTLPAAGFKPKLHDFDSQASRPIKGIVTPALSPDATRVAFVALNDLWVMPIGGDPVRITSDPWYEVHPAWSPDGRSLAYASDRDGLESIYIRDLETSAERRVAALDGTGISGTAFSPDGRRLAFQDVNGKTYVVDLATGGEPRPLPVEAFVPSRPSWSADGTAISMAALKTFSGRFREGVNQVLSVNVESGASVFYPVIDAFGSISSRGDDGPVYAPDGKSMLFVSGARLWSVPVTPGGVPNGAASVLIDRIAEAPSWSGDSRKVLYLSNGELRLFDTVGRSDSRVLVNLEYRRAIPAEPVVIRVGAIWDGVSRKLRRNVDIRIEGNRIRSIARAGKVPRGVRFVDARHLTAMPGLWDFHVHHEFFSPFTGDRLGRLNLAYGVTSIVSRGDLAYRVIEDRESLEAGYRVGPTLYATGEGFDGSRINYHVMRPITDRAQLDRELSRAKALDYDTIKTYVRLPADLMREATLGAQQLGLPTMSHYATPGLFVGQSGTAHLGGTQRLGYFRTISSAGRTYQDVIALYGAGKRDVVTTFQVTDYFLASEIANDPRMMLYTRSDLGQATRGNLAYPEDKACRSTACISVAAFSRLASAGANVLVGTDYFNPAIGVHGNIRMLVRHGWSSYDALRAASVVAAERQGVGADVGALQPGKIADLVLVEGDPLAKVEDAMRVRFTVRGGFVRTVDEILEPFASKREWVK